MTKSELVLKVENDIRIMQNAVDDAVAGWCIVTINDGFEIGECGPNLYPAPRDGMPPYWTDHGTAKQRLQQWNSTDGRCAELVNLRIYLPGRLAQAQKMRAELSNTPIFDETETRDIWIVRSLPKDKDYVVHCLADSEITAELSKSDNPDARDTHIVRTFKVGRYWYGPVNIEPLTEEHKALMYNAAVAKARSCGMSAVEITLLSGGQT